MRFLAVLIPACVGFVAFANAQQSPPPIKASTALINHRAVYEISLLANAGRNRLQSASGRMVYEFTGNACEGYSTNTRFVTSLQSEEGPAQLTDIRTVTHESGDGNELRFVTKAFSNQKARDEASGFATRQSDGAMQVKLDKPQTEIALFGKNVYFPTAHMMAAFKAANAGEKIFQADLFDGSDNGKKLFTTTSILSSPLNPAIPDTHPVTKMSFKAEPRHVMLVSFFDQVRPQDGEQTALYNIKADIFENGVSYAMKFDYGDFALSAKMTSIEVLPATPCK